MSSDDPSGVFSIGTQSPLAVEERDHQPVNITIVRSEGLFGNATVQYRLVDDTTYSLANTADTTIWDFSQGPSLYHTAVFSDGQATAVVSVDVIDDLRTEQAESFTLELVGTSDGRIDAGQASVVVVIGASDGPAECVGALLSRMSFLVTLASCVPLAPALCALHKGVRFSCWLS